MKWHDGCFYLCRVCARSLAHGRGAVKHPRSWLQCLLKSPHFHHNLFRSHMEALLEEDLSIDVEKIHHSITFKDLFLSHSIWCPGCIFWTIIVVKLTSTPISVPTAEKYLHNVMLPPACFTVGMDLVRWQAMLMTLFHHASYVFGSSLHVSS